MPSQYQNSIQSVSATHLHHTTSGTFFDESTMDIELSLTLSIAIY